MGRYHGVPSSLHGYSTVLRGRCGGKEFRNTEVVPLEQIGNGSVLSPNDSSSVGFCPVRETLGRPKEARVRVESSIVSHLLLLVYK